jgi:hypothetical protein
MAPDVVPSAQVHPEDIEEFLDYGQWVLCPTCSSVSQSSRS